MTAPIGRVRGRYAVEPGGKPVAPSVTGVLGAMVAKSGLQWGAAKVVSHNAVYCRDRLAGMSDEEAYHYLRKSFDVEWKEKSARGTLVHSFAADWVAGKEVECPPDCAPYLDALERFYDERDPFWHEVERSVVYAIPGLEYGGSFDGIVTLNVSRTFRRTWIIDIKTGGRYPVETTAQLAAYRYAQGLAVYSPLGGLERIDPMPEVDGAGVLYLHDDGTYELLEVPADRAAFDAFLAMRRAYGWLEWMKEWERRNREPRREEAGVTDDLRDLPCAGCVTPCTHDDPMTCPCLDEPVRAELHPRCAESIRLYEADVKAGNL